jgi:uncharacterized protein
MIIDSHAHLGPAVRYIAPDTKVGTMLDLMDYLGIEITIQMHMAGFLDLWEEAYCESEKAFEVSRGRIFYALIYDPRYGEESLHEVSRGLGRPGFVGVKIHPSLHLTYGSDARYELVWQFAAENKLPIITHTWAVSDYNPSQKFSTPEHFETYLSRFPQVNLVMGHSGGRYEGHLAAVRLAKKYPNLFLDTSGDVASPGFVEWLVSQVGAERVCFGSDANMMDPRTNLGRVLDAELPVDEKRLILGDNAHRLFKLPG